MIYTYRCEKCNTRVEVIKTMSEVDRTEHCAICNSKLQRVWKAPMISTADGVKR